MDACLQKFETSMGSAPTTPTSTDEVAATSSPRRVARWDSKREKCNNCELIFLKTLSQHLGFCSVDCKSNMTYLQKVNRTIRAMVDERQRLQEQEPLEEQQDPQPVEAAQQQPLAKVQPIEASPKVDTTAHSLKHAQSFAEFGLETRVLDASNVEWSFSAVY